ncbi:MAG: ribonuclease M5 [Bacillota bacterium]|nr:ribonuclease M5 [Bacillota bacterium]
MIKEVIVVEGRDDEQVVKRAVEADVIQTHGYAYGKGLIEKLKKLDQTRGLIIFTDPDYVGKKIRKDLAEKIPGAKHAFLPRGKAIKGEDIGVENASPEDVRRAIEKAKPQERNSQGNFVQADLNKYGLSGRPNSKQIREQVAARLNIDYGNGKQFLRILNSFQVTREELEKVLEEIDL